MRAWIAPAALLGLAVSLSACVYPDGPYGPGYGPPPPPPPRDYGPPPNAPEYGPPPPSSEAGPPPEDEAGPPQEETGSGPPGGPAEAGPPPGDDGYASGPRPPRAMRPHGSRWCARHPHRCARQMRHGGYEAPPPDEQAPPEDQPPPDDQPPPQE